MGEWEAQKLYNTFSELAAKAGDGMARSPKTTAENATNRIKVLWWHFVIPPFGILDPRFAPSRIPPAAGVMA
jgi:hypothetical protein